MCDQVSSWQRDENGGSRFAGGRALPGALWWFQALAEQRAALHRLRFGLCWVGKGVARSHLPAANFTGMTGVGAPVDSLRLSRREMRRLGLVLALSLVLHLVGWGGYEAGKEFGWWQQWHWPNVVAAPGRHENQTAPAAKQRTTTGVRGCDPAERPKRRRIRSIIPARIPAPPTRPRETRRFRN